VGVFLVPGPRFLWPLWLILSFLSAVLAMKTKETAFTLPVVIALYEFCFFSSSFSIRDSRFTIHGLSRFLYLAPLLLTMGIIPLTLLYLKATMGTGKHDLPGVSFAVLPRWEYMITQFRVLITYLRLLFLPVNQNFDYDYPVFKSFFDPQVILSFLFLSALFGSGIYLIRSSRFTSHVSRPFRLIGFGILWFFITLSVESSIVPLDRLMDEYRVYMPSTGIIIAAVTGLFFVFSRFTSHVSRSLVARSLIVSLVLVTGVLAIAAYNR